MKKSEEHIDLIKDLQLNLSRALNGQVIREYDHLQVRCEKAINKHVTESKKLFDLPSVFMGFSLGGLIAIAYFNSIIYDLF